MKWSTKQKQAVLIESMMNRYPFLQMSSRGVMQVFAREDFECV